MPNPPLEQAPRGDLLELEVEGNLFTGWSNVEVTRAIDAISGSFSVTVNPTPKVAWPIRPGNEVKVRVGDEVLLTGYVDAFEGNSTKSGGRTVTVSGRDKTADLVDCSAVNEPNQWLNRGLHDIVKDLAAPFGIGLRNLIGRQDPFPLFKVNPGESPWTAIDRAARLRATLVYSDGNGDVILARPGPETAEADLVEGPGGNVLSSAVSLQNQQRFAEYRIVGQQSGSDEGWGVSSAGVEGRATDPEILRFRPIVIVAEGQVDIAAARARAEWEAITRAARGANLEIVVQGWRETLGVDGRLWAVNRLVFVVLPSWQIKGTMLIRAVRFSRTRDAGILTTLSLVRKDAYTAEPAVDVDSQPFPELLDGDDYADL